MSSVVRALASSPGLCLPVVRLALSVALVLACAPCTAAAQGEARVAGRVADDTGAPLPGASVELITAGGRPRVTVTDADGHYAFEDVARGTYTIVVALVNFGPAVHRGVVVDGREVRRDAVLQLSMSADVTVVARRGFANLADVDDPAQSLVGIAQSASQGAITARQLDVRPIMRQGEVLETVPGVIVTQHSGEGKANQYFLRGFNLDHGSDFAVSVAGAPVNMPTHAHSQGYADVNFLIPEIVAGVQFSKGPYFADQGDFATAGAATITLCDVAGASVPHARARRVRLQPRPAGALAESRARARCSRRWSCRTTPDRGPCPTPTTRPTRCCATAAATASTAWRSRMRGITAPGTPPRRRRSAPSTTGGSIASAPSIRPTPARPAATASPSSGSAADRGRSRR